MDDKKLTVEEVVEILRALDGTFNFDECEVSDVVDIALHEAIMLLERFMKKKPKKVNMQNVCPACGEHVKYCYSFCKRCGWALDWN